MGIKYSFLFSIVVVLIFLQDFTIKIASQQLYICSIAILFILFLILIFKTKDFFITVKNVVNYTSFKYLLLCIFWLVMTSLFCGSVGTVLKINFRILLIWGLVILSTIFITFFSIPKYISYKKCLKLFIIMYQFIMYYGIINFIARLFYIYPLMILHNFVCTRAVLQSGKSFLDINQWERATSLFFEPSFFATFIFLFLPLAYVLANRNILLFKNRIKDKLFKASLIVITWLNLIFTMSPMYIVLCCLYTIIFFSKSILKHLRKKQNILIVCFIVILSIPPLLIITPSINFSNNKVFHRVLTTTKSFGDFNSLVETEVSLATRILTSANTWIAAKKHPIKGVGFGNDHDIMYQQYTTTNLPMTWEIIEKAILEDSAGSASNIFFSMLLQAGWIGIILLYLFFINSIVNSFKIKSYKNSNNAFLEIIQLISINYIIISFYWGYITYPIMWFIFAILNTFIYQLNLKIRSKQKFILKGVFQ